MSAADAYEPKNQWGRMLRYYPMVLQAGRFRVNNYDELLVLVRESWVALTDQETKYKLECFVKDSLKHPAYDLRVNLVRIEQELCRKAQGHD